MDYYPEPEKSCTPGVQFQCGKHTTGKTKHYRWRSSRRQGGLFSRALLTAVVVAKPLSCPPEGDATETTAHQPQNRKELQKPGSPHTHQKRQDVSSSRIGETPKSNEIKESPTKKANARQPQQPPQYTHGRIGHLKRYLKKPELQVNIPSLIEREGGPLTCYYGCLRYTNRRRAPRLLF